MNKTFIIGICGGSCSGKSSVAEYIKSISPSKISIVKQDSYYGIEDNSNIDPSTIDFDAPSSINWDLLINNIKSLKSGIDINEPIYDFKTHRQLDITRFVRATSVVIVEGILIFNNKHIMDLLDMKIFIDADSDVRYRRRVSRDMKERGRTNINNIDFQWDTFVKPSYNKYIKDTKKYADIILLNNSTKEKVNGECIVGLKCLDVYIRHLIN